MRLNRAVVLAGASVFVLGVLALAGAGHTRAEEEPPLPEDWASWRAYRSEFVATLSKLDGQVQQLIRIVESSAAKPEVRMDAMRCLGRLVPTKVYTAATSKMTVRVIQGPATPGSVVEYPFWRLLSLQPWDVTPRVLDAVARRQSGNPWWNRHTALYLLDRWPAGVGKALLEAWTTYHEEATGKPCESLRAVREMMED